MPREIKEPQVREYEEIAELERARQQYSDREQDDLDRRADEARELDHNPMKHVEYQQDVAAELDDLEEWQGPDA